MKFSKTIYHFIFWLAAYVFWIFVFRNSTLVLTHAITIQFCYLVFIAANYYLNTLYAIPLLLNRKRYVGFSFCLIAGVLVTALIRVPVSVMVITYIFKIPHPHFNYTTIFLDSFINILFWVICILAAKMVIEKIRSQVYIEQIEKEKATNELNFLRAQFNPHFLFNSINSIYGHIDKTNKEARDMLLVFSDMLRYQLYECNVERIDLNKELNYVRNYIALQKARMDERVIVNFRTDMDTEQVKIAPLLLITFIENAFKYVGFNEDKINRVDIFLECRQGMLFFEIFNTKDSYINPVEQSSGLGIANTKRRLELLYPGKHRLIIDNQETDYKLTLNLFDL